MAVHGSVTSVAGCSTGIILQAVVIIVVAYILPGKVSSLDRPVVLVPVPAFLAGWFFRCLFLYLRVFSGCSGGFLGLSEACLLSSIRLSRQADYFFVI